MNIKNKIQNLFDEKVKENENIVVNLLLHNGNILLKSFHITHWDPISQTLSGLTMNEEYAYQKEERKPVYCLFNITEIKDILECEYNNVILPAM